MMKEVPDESRLKKKKGTGESKCRWLFEEFSQKDNRKESSCLKGKAELGEQYVCLLLLMAKISREKMMCGSREYPLGRYERRQARVHRWKTGLCQGSGQHFHGEEGRLQV